MSAIFALFLLALPGTLSVNLVDQPGSSGPEVVTTVVNMIRSNCILAEDKLFLRRLAYVETRDGSLPGTYSNPSFDGGIWQVTRDMLKATQTNRNFLSPLYTIIKNALKIDWLSVSWSDLRKPLYSGIAAALYLNLQMNRTSAYIPLKIEEQGTFWRDYYHTGGRPYNYTAVVEELNLGCRGNNKQVDLVFIVDSSSSLSDDDFKRVQYFLRDIISGFNIGPNTAHVAVITYATSVKVEFFLNSHTNKVEVNTAINNLRHVGGATNTAGALNEAVNDVFDTVHGARANVVKVAVLITDGRSDDFINTKNAAELVRSRNIALFTVGVGNKIDANELTSIATKPSCTHAFSVQGFDSIANLKQEIQDSVCRAPLYANSTVSCIVGECPPYAFPFTGDNGITLQGSLNCGRASVFADINNFYPSSVHNLYNVIVDRPGIAKYQAKPDLDANFLYVTIAEVPGSVKGCNITLTPLVGDQTVHEVEVICKEQPSGRERACQKKDLTQFRPLICDGSQSMLNPCTKEDAAKGTLYPYAGDNTRYIKCLPNGLFQVILCPAGNIFDSTCKVCYGANVPRVDCTGNGYTGKNPCTAQNLLNDEFYFIYPGDQNKYIQCDLWGKPWIRNCNSGDVWVQEHRTCETPGTSYNPCPQMRVDGQRFYSYPPDMHQYIECVDAQNPQVLNCSSSQVWDDCVKTCLPLSRLTCGVLKSTSAPYVRYSTYAPYVRYSTYAPATTQFLPYYSGVFARNYKYPCTQAHIANNQLYFPVQGNKRQYVQCDLNGNSYLKSCPNNDPYFNPNSDTCVDGPLAIDGNFLNGFGKK